MGVIKASFAKFMSVQLMLIEHERCIDQTHALFLSLNTNEEHKRNVHYWQQ